MQVTIKNGVMLALVGALVACQGATGKQGLEGPTGPQGPQGPQGPAGAAGQDGSLRIYGDGSAGAVTIATNTNWITAPPAEFNLNFASLTINSGVTLTVPSGTVIRCTDTFTNAGTIVVDTYALGGGVKLTNTSATEALVTPPDPGISRGPPGIGERAVGSGANCDGGKGGTAILRSSAAQLLNPGPAGGGGGAGATRSTLGTLESTGGAGGGTLVILAKGALNNSNTGTIRANGGTASGDGAGGGGGGIIVLASQTSVVQNGTVTVVGTAGGVSGISTGPGGGGGGGVVLLVAPDANNIGTIDVSGGLAGTLGAPGTATATGSRMGGGGGGASGGNGGAGGDLSGTNPLAAAAGIDGFFIVRRMDPTTLF